jgi:hypothetical protein
MKLLIDIVMHPRKYDGVQNLPLRFDAAEALLPFWNKLSAKVQHVVEEVLVKSGYYKSNP